MHIGCCENCKYVDLVENVTGVCPRCGSIIESLGIESFAWNAMGDDERAAIIAGKFTEDNTITNVINDAEPQNDEEQKITDDIPATEPDEEVPEAESEEEEAETETETDEESDDDIKKVYVCYKCSSVVTHSGKHNAYYCKDCGADMVDVGYTSEGWAMLTKEEKRNITEDAKIRHMVLKIKNTTYDDEENVTTQNIVNVVRE